MTSQQSWAPAPIRSWVVPYVPKLHSLDTFSGTTCLYQVFPILPSELSQFFMAQIQKDAENISEFGEQIVCCTSMMCLSCSSTSQRSSFGLRGDVEPIWVHWPHCHEPSLKEVITSFQVHSEPFHTDRKLFHHWALLLSQLLIEK